MKNGYNIKINPSHIIKLKEDLYLSMKNTSNKYNVGRVMKYYVIFSSRDIKPVKFWYLYLR